MFRIQARFRDFSAEQDYLNDTTVRSVPLIRAAIVITTVALPTYWFWDRLAAEDTPTDTLRIRVTAAGMMFGILVLSVSWMRRHLAVILVAGYSVITVANTMVMAELDLFVEGHGAFMIGPLLGALVASTARQLAACLLVSGIVPLAAMALDGGAEYLEVIAPWLALVTGFAVVAWVVLDRTRRERFDLDRQLRAERERSESLLHNVLPEDIAERLKAGESVADRRDQVTVLFADVVGFTQFARHRDPAVVVAVLNDVFSRFDALVNRAGMEKIKTIGDGYMVATKFPEDGSLGARRAVDLAQSMHDVVATFSEGRGLGWSLRVGLHTGSVVSGVIGTSKFAYDLWGDTVNVASRLESSGQAGRTLVSNETACLLGLARADEGGTLVSLRGHGSHRVHWLDDLHGFDHVPAQ